MRRGAGAAAVDCVVNLSGAPCALPDGVLLTCSDTQLEGGELPPDAAAWVRAT
jgi:hypothetical protein